MKRKHTGKEFPDIKRKIHSGDYTVRVPTDKKKYTHETTWKLMRLIFDDEDKQLPDFFFCSKCNDIFNLSLRNSGQCLARHVKACMVANPSVSEFYTAEFQPAKRKKIKYEDKILVREAAMSFVIQDMRPISSLGGDGIANLLSRMTYIGSKYGHISEEDLPTTKLIPSRQTVSCNSVVKTVRNVLLLIN